MNYKNINKVVNKLRIQDENFDNNFEELLQIMDKVDDYYDNAICFMPVLRAKLYKTEEQKKEYMKKITKHFSIIVEILKDSNLFNELKEDEQQELINIAVTRAYPSIILLETTVCKHKPGCNRPKCEDKIKKTSYKLTAEQRETAIMSCLNNLDQCNIFSKITTEEEDKKILALKKFDRKICVQSLKDTINSNRSEVRKLAIDRIKKNSTMVYTLIHSKSFQEQEKQEIYEKYINNKIIYKHTYAYNKFCNLFKNQLKEEDIENLIKYIVNPSLLNNKYLLSEYQQEAMINNISRNYPLTDQLKAALDGVLVLMKLYK